MIILRKDFSNYKINVIPDSTELDEEVCVDLHVGDSFMEAGGSTAYPFNKPYTLNPSACIVVRTKEKITLPKNIFGTLCAKGSLAALGFLTPNTKVDPMYSDVLNVAIFNAGNRPLKVESGMAFCSIVFHSLNGDINRETNRRGIIIIELEQQKLVFLKKINKHVDSWRGVYGLAAALLAILYGVLKATGKLP